MFFNAYAHRIQNPIPHETASDCRERVHNNNLGIRFIVISRFWYNSSTVQYTGIVLKYMKVIMLSRASVTNNTVDWLSGRENWDVAMGDHGGHKGHTAEI